MTYTAYKNGWIASDPFAGFYVKVEYSDRYLSASELQAVMDVKLPNYRTGINRDVFVFCAFTGLSHADVVKLTHADIHTDDNGERWIIDKRQKTGTQFRVKLLPVAEMIYDRYKDLHLAGDKVFPLKGNYKTLNMSLRQVARHAGLSFNPMIHCARHTFATTITLTQGIYRRRWKSARPCESPAFCWSHVGIGGLLQLGRCFQGWRLLDTHIIYPNRHNIRPLPTFRFHYPLLFVSSVQNGCRLFFFSWR